MTAKRKKDVSTATHPEDISGETRAIDASHEIIDAFFDRHREEFVQLVLTYSDFHAEKRLESLREKFWGSDELTAAEKALAKAEKRS